MGVLLRFLSASNVKALIQNWLQTFQKCAGLMIRCKPLNQKWYLWSLNKANLRDLIAATSLVILLKWDSNHQLFNPCDLEIWWMTSKNHWAQIHWWIQTGVTVQKHSIRQLWSKSAIFLSCVTLKFYGWPWETIGHFFYTPSSFVHCFKAISELKLELQSGNAQFGSKSEIFCPMWPWNLTDDLENQ